MTRIKVMMIGFVLLILVSCFLTCGLHTTVISATMIALGWILKWNCTRMEKE
jgi:hypothetical protein